MDTDIEMSSCNPYKNIIVNLIRTRVFRYILVGGVTTLVNFSLFWILNVPAQLGPNTSNIIAVLFAVLFAYVANKIFVFKSNSRNFYELIKECLSFFLSRGATMLTEIFGLFILHNVFGMYPLLAKIIINIVVIILNYLLARDYVFKPSS